MTTRQAPEIFQTALDSIAVEGLPPITDSGFEQAVIAHYALKYGAKGWNAAVVVSDGFVLVVAVPQEGVEPKAYLLGLLRHGYIEDALPGLEPLPIGRLKICTDTPEVNRFREKRPVRTQNSENGVVRGQQVKTKNPANTGV